MDIVKNHKKLFIIIVIVIVVIFAFVAKLVFGSGRTQTVLQTPDVSTITTQDLDQRVTADGTVVAANPESIFIELSQEVETVYVELGDEVEEGQLLVTYDIEDTRQELEDRIEEAQLSVENAQIALDELTTPAEGTELIDLQSAVVSAEKALENAKTTAANSDLVISQAEAAYETAKTTVENNAELLKIGGITQSEYDSSVTSMEAAEESLNNAKTAKTTNEQDVQEAELALEKAKINLENGQNRSNDPDTANSIKQQQNNLASAQMTLRSAQQDLEKLTEASYSPISGTIIENNAIEGQMLTDSTVMMEVADLSDLDVEAYVSEYDIAKVKVGQTVEMTSDGIEDKVYIGTVTKIEPVAESRSTISGDETTVPIVVHIENPDEDIKPGFSLDMEIIVVDLSDVLTVPISAVMQDDDGSTYVFKVEEDDTITKTTIEIGTYSDMYAEVVSGLQDGDRVMTSPDEDVTDGSKLSDYEEEVTVNTGTTQESTDSSSSSMQMGGMGGGGMGGGMPGGGGMGGGGPR